MNAQEHGDTGFLAKIRQLSAGGSHGWGRTAITKIGDGPRFVLDRPLAECSLLATFTT